MIFLVLFSYTLLFQFKYIDGENAIYNQTNSTDPEKYKNFDNHFLSVFDILLLVWVTAIIAEEFRQV